MACDGRDVLHDFGAMGNSGVECLLCAGALMKKALVSGVSVRCVAKWFDGKKGPRISILNKQKLRINAQVL